MNSAIKAAILKRQSNYLWLGAALFHSTPVLLEQKRGSYSYRLRRRRANQELLRNIRYEPESSPLDAMHTIISKVSQRSSSSEYSKNRHSYKEDWSWAFNQDSDPSTKNGHFEKEKKKKRKYGGTAAERRALGLRAYGPLTLEDVKIAYRASALKWHPDRHDSPSKAFAEQKFKLCNSAYQSLCHKLGATND